MEGSASACRRRGIRPRCLVAGALLLAALAVAPAVRADPGPAEDAPPAAEAGDAQGSVAGGDGGANGSSAVAPSHDDPPGPQTAPVDGPPGSSGNVPGQAQSTGDSGNAPVHDEPPGNSGDAPGHQDDGPVADVEQGASVAQQADAAASAEQQDVDNTAVTVRVDEPGNGKKVGQENRADADADAAAVSVVDGDPGASVVQQAHADAAAAQADVSNTSIVVRVGSAGNDEGVSQTNVAAGSATATTLSDRTASGVADAAALATQDGVANTSVSVRIFSPGDDGAVSQLNAVLAAAQASPGGTESVDVRQDDARNTSVSIRVESPGAASTPVQENRATTSSSADDDAGSTGGLAVAMAGDAGNTVLTVAVGGTSLDRPAAGGPQVWVWTWVWQRDEADDLSALAGLEPDSWNWSWIGTGTGGTGPRGNVTSRAAEDGERGRGGSLEWSWDWTRAGVADWTWDWDRRLALSCSSCIWIWNWSWSWTGQPGDDATRAAPSAAPGSPGQLNAVTARAAANATSLVVQTVLQDGSGASTQFAGQLVDVTQSASAVAAARQTSVSSVAWDGDLGQANVLSSSADTGLNGVVDQRLWQSLVTEGAGLGGQWGGQQADLTQLGSADASATQHGVLLLGPGSHDATGSATSASAAGIDQGLRQGALATGGTVSQWAGQLVVVEQRADATTSVAQTGVGRFRRTGGAALASARAGELALVTQNAEQSAARSGETGSQSIAQLAYAGQDASASAATAQQGGATTGSEAWSDAEALARAELLQDASQSANGASVVVQDLVQQASVVQSATASATSNGGIAGRATVVDCAIVQQGATQTFAAGPARAQTPDDRAFCLRTAGPSSSSPAVHGSPTAAGGELAATGAETGSPTTLGTGVGRASGATTSHSGPPAAAHPTHRSSSAPSAPAPAGLAPGRTQLSAPPSPQARIDTRPGSHAGAGDAGREPPLPPVGGLQSRVSALAAAASGAGGSGIAAILFAFALVAPLLRRAPEGSVVRRPADVLARIDIPV